MQGCYGMVDGLLAKEYKVTKGKCRVAIVAKE